jgi:RNA-directed DNA polymerase
MINSLNHLYRILGTSETEVKAILNGLDKYYYYENKPKLNKDGSCKTKDGKLVFRVLTPSIGRLKEIQRQIKNKILKEFIFPNFVQGGVSKRDNISNAIKHQGKKFHFMTDLKGFFPSIKYKLVYDMFISNKFSADVSSILTKLTTYNYCLPQGTPTSTYIANLVALDMDKELIKFCELFNITYTRYVDDLSFSCPADFKDKTVGIISIIQDNSYVVNFRKTHYKVGPAEITGVVAKNNHISPPTSIKIKMSDNNTPESSRMGIKNYYNRIISANIK